MRQSGSAERVGGVRLWTVLVLGLAPVCLPTAPVRANQPPTARAESAATAVEPVLVDVLANDSDPDGDRLTVTLASNPAVGTVDNPGDGTLVYVPPSAGFAEEGQVSFTYTVADGRGGSDEATVTVDALPPPPAPPQEPAELFHDDFSIDPFARWDIFDLGGNDAPSDWQWAEGRLAQLSNIWGYPGTLAVYSGGSFGDVKVRLQMESTDNNRIGLAFRVQDQHNYYAFDMDASTKTRQLVRVVGGAVEVLTQAAGSYAPNKPRDVEVVTSGPELTVYLDSVEVLSVTDSTYAKGTIALLSDANSGSYYDEVRVTELPAAPPTELLRETFDSDFDGWRSADDEEGGGPSSWLIEFAQLKQATNIFGYPATYAIYEDGRGWTDYRASLLLRSTDDDRIGVLFRYQDPDNFYGFDMSAQADTRRLVRMLDGELTVLAEQAAGYVHDDPHRVEVEVEGEALTVWLDGVEILSAIDPWHRTGTLALESDANQDSYFDHVIVTEVP